jgi:predicted outer membrane protein
MEAAIFSALAGCAADNGLNNDDPTAAAAQLAVDINAIEAGKAARFQATLHKVAKEPATASS